MSETKIIKKSAADEVSKEETATACEQQLAVDLEIISLLRDNPDILERRPELLSLLEISHRSGSAVSLIERQVTVLRQQLKTEEERLRELMNVARDNQRLADSRHRLALNLFAAHDLDDVVSIVLDALGNELSADHAIIKLFSEDTQRVEQSAGLFVDTGSDALKAFKTMLEHKNTVCGKATEEQKTFLFEDSADSIKSLAIIPLVAGANLGVIGLGANDVERFNASMGTDFLSHIGELISASLAVHLEG